MKLADIIVPDAIIPSLASTTRQEAIAELLGAIADTGSIAGDSVSASTDALMAREAQSSTGIGNGVAFPHARINGIKKPLCAIGCSSEGIEFDSIDGNPVNLVLLLLSSSEDPAEHLEAMEAVFKHVQRKAFRDELACCKTRDEIVDIVRDADVVL